MSARRCDWCARFVATSHPCTVRYCYGIDFDLPVAVYSRATATRLVRQLLCHSCAPSARCYAIHEAGRETGTAVGGRLRNGWEPCEQTATQADYAEATS
jgi:hypothetical protein